jgi:hypothetical protein
MEQVENEEEFTNYSDWLRNNDESRRNASVIYEATLRAEEFQKIVFSLSGESDEGHICFDYAEDIKGNVIYSMPSFLRQTAFVDENFKAHSLIQQMIEDVNYAAGLGWEDDQGSSGTIQFMVYADRPGVFIFIDMIENDPCNDPDYEDMEDDQEDTVIEAHLEQEIVEVSHEELDKEVHGRMR